MRRFGSHSLSVFSPPSAGLDQFAERRPVRAIGLHGNCGSLVTMVKAQARLTIVERVWQPEQLCSVRAV